MTALLITVAFTSCKKDWTCKCTFTTGPDFDLPFTNATKGDAKDACDAAETTYKMVDAGAKCELL